MSEAGANSPADLVEQGRALHRLGRLDDAERLYARALAADEDFAEAHQLMAVIAGQRGHVDAAIAGFRRTIALDGPTPDRLYNLAEAYKMRGDMQPAVNAYNQALTIDAAYLDAYRSCAAMIEAAAGRARTDGDAASAERLARLAAHYLIGLGHARLRTAHVAEAEQAYRQAVALDPENAEAFNCLGVIALESLRIGEAETLLQRAHALEPKSPTYLNNLGRALLSLVRVEEAKDYFRRALEIDPTFAEARQNLEERTLLWLHYRADLPPAALSAAHRDWGRLEMERSGIGGRAVSGFRNPRDPERPLNVAYVAFDTGAPLAQRFFAPLLQNHDREQIRTVAYSTSGTVEGDRFFKAALGQLRAIPLRRAQDIARVIQGEGTDIIVDLAGHQPQNGLQIFAYKPAPLAVTWLGYPDTTGLPAIDYRITDEVMDPPGAEGLSVERLFRMHAGCLVYRPPEEAPEPGPAPCRNAGAVTFGYFDDPRKISPEVVQAWSAILGELPAAGLLLQANEFADPILTERLEAGFKAAGIPPARIRMRRPPESPAAELGAYSEVDIMLDTFPFNCGPATTCDTLWMGVPEVALWGDRPCARVSASLLAQTGLERLVSETPDEYVATAVELAQDLDRLRVLRAGMRQRMRVSSLMDERGFARRFEAALREMWRQWCKTGA